MKCASCNFYSNDSSKFEYHNYSGLYVIECTDIKKCIKRRNRIIKRNNIIKKIWNILKPKT